MSRLPDATIPLSSQETAKLGAISRTRMPAVARSALAPDVRAASSSSRATWAIEPPTARLAIGVVPTMRARSTIHCVP